MEWQYHSSLIAPNPASLPIRDVNEHFLNSSNDIQLGKIFFFFNCITQNWIYECYSFHIHSHFELKSPEIIRKYNFLYKGRETTLEKNPLFFSVRLFYSSVHLHLFLFGDVQTGDHLMMHWARGETHPVLCRTIIPLVFIPLPITFILPKYARCVPLTTEESKTLCWSCAVSISHCKSGCETMFYFSVS